MSTHGTRRSACAAIALMFLRVLAAPECLSERRNEVVATVEEIMPAVVNISTEQIVQQPGHDPFRDPIFDYFFQEFFGVPQSSKQTSLGSGVVIDGSGLIVTNEHVIHRASKIVVTLNDGRAYDAELISSNSKNDLAVIKINVDAPLHAVSLADSDAAMIGETVIAIGNPFGHSNTVTTGVLSATGRAIRSEDGQVLFEDFLQTDAAINPGNSGGALINMDGELVGIIIAIRAQAEGIGYAIPANRVANILDDLLDFEIVKQLWVGFRVANLSNRQRKDLRFSGLGVLVVQLDPGGPAERAGIRKNDIITRVDGRPVDSNRAFSKIFLNKEVGDRVGMSVYRHGKHWRNVTVEVQAFPRQSNEAIIWKRLGLALIADVRTQNFYWGRRERRGLKVVKVKQGGPAESIGLKKNDFIIQVGNLRIRNPETMVLLLDRLPRGAFLPVTILRGRDRLNGSILLD